MAHGDLGGHPVVVAAGEILLPRPLVLEWEELVDVGAAVDHGFIVDADAGAPAIDVAEAGGLWRGDVCGGGLGEDQHRGCGFEGFVPIEGVHGCPLGSVRLVTGRLRRWGRRWSIALWLALRLRARRR
jgi:hypothetical protein